MYRYDPPASITDAIRIQKEMRPLVRLQDDFPALKYIAGIDVGYDVRRKQSKAALVLIRAGAFEPEISAFAFAPTDFPYISGLLSFREVPVILEVLKCLKTPPDLLFVDGQGIAHPRRLGLAAHLGVVTGLPSIGVAKSRLCGHYQEPGLVRGASSPLIDKGERIGTVYRSRNNVKPLFISPGHRVSQERAVKLVAQYLTHYRLPEPTRLADKLSKIVASREMALN